MLVLLEPVSARPVEPIRRQRSRAVEHVDGVHHHFHRTAELPAVVRGEVVVRGHEHLDAGSLCRPEQGLQIRDGVVRFDRRADEAPGDTIWAQKIVLRIGDDERRALDVDLHAWIRQLGHRRSG